MKPNVIKFFFVTLDVLCSKGLLVCWIKISKKKKKNQHEEIDRPFCVFGVCMINVLWVKICKTKEYIKTKMYENLKKKFSLGLCLYYVVSLLRFQKIILPLSGEPFGPLWRVFVANLKVLKCHCRILSLIDLLAKKVKHKSIKKTPPNFVTIILCERKMV